MKIEKTSSPAFQAASSDSFPHEGDIRKAFKALMAHNAFRLHHCARHPEDLGIDHVIDCIMLHLEKAEAIKQDEREEVRNALEYGLAATMLDEQYSEIRKSDEYMERSLSEFDWSLFDRASFSMRIDADWMQFCSRFEDYTREEVRELGREATRASFVCNLYYSLDGLLGSLASKNVNSIDLKMKDVVGYVEFDMRCRMGRYCLHEHVFDSFLEDYIVRMMPKASNNRGIKVNLVS